MATIALVLAAVFMAPGGQPPTAQAEDYTIGCNANDLLTAVGSANSSPAASRIELAGGCVYLLTGSHNNGANGPNGFPVISAAGGPLTIIGNGAAIQRAGETPNFRFFEVQAGATLTLADIELRNGNSGTAEGGAILNFGTLELISAYVRENRSGIDGSSGAGGGLSNRGEATIRRSAFFNNISGDDGGAIYFNGSALTIESSTIALNEARGTPGIGGGIMAVDDPVTLNNVTIVNNTALATLSAGGGIYSFFPGAVYTITNSIIANNTADENANCSAAIGPVSETNLEFGAVSCASFVNADPQLTFDTSGRFYTPSLISSAASGGNLITCAAVDQRGVFRAGDGACAIGAVEIDAGKATIDFNDADLIGQNGAAALTALNATYGSRGLGFDAFRAVPFGEFSTDGADVTVFTDPAGADILINFAYPVDQVSIEMLVTNGVNSVLTARNNTGTAADIEASGGLVIDSDTRTTPGPLNVAGACIRSVQLENVGFAFTFDDVTFRPQPGADADNNGVIDSCETVALNPFAVTNTADSGPGSLRAAITAANAQPGLDTITFNIPGSGFQLITPQSALPAISDPVLIDGYSQPGSAANTSAVGWNSAVQIGLVRGGTGENGLEFQPGSAGSTVRGIAFRAYDTAIVINADAITVAGNRIGLGTPDDASSNTIGVEVIGGTGSVIGGAANGARNLIAGNLTGIRVGAGAQTIENNYIGTLPSGAADTTYLNTVGVQISAGAGTVVRGNVIGNNAQEGLVITAANTQALGNLIGLNAAGNAAAPNGANGVLVENTTAVTIGGTTAAARNIISGNLNYGVEIDSSSNVVVSGNYIGTNAAGNAAVPNNSYGLHLLFSQNATIGGATAAAGNLISGNTIGGINMQGSTNTGHTIRNNRIGVSAGGAALGNLGNGITISTDGGNHQVRDNLVAFSTNLGILVFSDDNVFTGNTLRDNAWSGMQLSGANNTVGGLSAAERNVISGNNQGGLNITGSGTTGNVIQGNYIGVEADGTTADGNAFVGLAVTSGAANNTIGGTAAGAGNIIANNGFDGVVIESNGNSFSGNTIRNNDEDGIQVFPGSTNNTLGGATAAAGNLITANGEAGIRLNGGSANSVLSNRIFANAEAQLLLINNANGNPTAPTVTTAIPGFPTAGQSNVQGWLTNGAPNTNYTVQLFSGTGCAPGGIAEARTFLAGFTVTTDADGIAPFTRDLAQLLPAGGFVSATATDSAGNTSALATCAFVGPDNTVWYQALPLSAATPSLSQPLGLAEQVRWYYVEVEPQSRLAVNLTNLPAGYDLALFNDLNARAEALVAAADEDFAAALAVTQTQIDYTTVESSNFSTNTLAPELYSPEAYTSVALAPGTFRPDVIAEAVASPFKSSPFKSSPFKSSPFKSSPFKSSPFKSSPFKSSDLAGIVIDSGLLSYTEIEGTLPRTLTLNSYNERGRVYIAVYGRNGAFDPVQPFTVSAFTSGSACANVTPPAANINGLTAQAGNFQTLFLTDLSRLPGSAAERDQLEALITSFNSRAEIAGTLVNVGADARVAAANATADNRVACPDAKNLVANEIKRIVDDYRALNPNLRYIVLVGGDEVIPFFRYPDQALLGNESEFQPPVDNNSSSEAALRLGYILGQDQYGARYTIGFRTTSLAIPDLPVGRLVETAADAITMINQYIAADGVLTPDRSFVSGYDFHFESASGIADGLELGTARPVDTLLSPSTDSYQEPGTWTATDLRDALAGADYDLLYLAGHFSDGALKAADYATILRTADLLNLAPTRLAGALVVSPGCHSGYNTPDGAAIPGATDQPDWAQFFAQRGTTVVGGTGYQYGDTQFTQFAEELYTRFFEQLRIDAVPNSPQGDEVAIGQALVIAKQRYLLDSAVIRGIDKKTLTISTLFGLPMTRVDMQGQRLTPPPAAPLPSTFGPLTPLGDVGDIYQLQAANVTVNPNLTVETIDLTSLESGATLPATYVRGATEADIIARPGEPVLPLSQYRIGQAGQQVRGALLLSAAYSELTNVLPLTGAPATELRGVHIAFPTEAFYPEKWWTINQLGELADVSGGDRARLQLTPAQFLANPSQNRGTIRYYDGPVQFRLFYSDQTEADSNGVNPALAGAPAIPVVTFSRDGALVNVQVSANGGGVPLREVWLTFTADAGPLAGQWQSIQLTPSATDPTLYTGSYSMPNGTEGFSFFVQAANAAGFTALNTNLGLYYQAGGFVNNTLVPPPLPPVTPSDATAQETTLSLNLPSAATFGVPATFTAQLNAVGGGGLSGQTISLSVGAQTVTAVTNGAGQATFTLPPFSAGTLPIGATFSGASALQPAFAVTSLTIAKQQPTLATIVTDTDVIATLTAESGGIQGARLYLSVGGVVVSGRTNPEGTVILPIPAIEAGEYPFSVTYLLAPTANGLVEESDARYLPATTTGTLTAQGAGLDTLIETGSEGSTGDSAVTFSFSGSGATELRFECSLSQPGAPEDFAPCVSPLSYKGLANGDYVFSVRAVATDGTVDATPAERSFTVNQIVYRARQQGARVWIERNIAAAGLNDIDTGPPDGWALVGRTNGASDNGELRGFYVENGVPYAIVFNRSRNKGNRCILLTPRSLDQVRRGQTRLVNIVLDPVPCPAPTGVAQLP